VKITRSHLRKIIKEELSRTLILEQDHRTTITNSLGGLMTSVGNRQSEFEDEYSGGAGGRGTRHKALSYMIYFDLSQKVQHTPEPTDAQRSLGIIPEPDGPEIYSFTVEKAASDSEEANQSLISVIEEELRNLLAEPEFMTAMESINSKSARFKMGPLDFNMGIRTTPH